MDHCTHTPHGSGHGARHRGGGMHGHRHGGRGLCRARGGHGFARPAEASETACPHCGRHCFGETSQCSGGENPQREGADHG